MKTSYIGTERNIFSASVIALELPSAHIRSKTGANMWCHFSILLSIFFTLCSFVATAATYYIAPNGSDAANGDITHPFATLNKAWTVAAAGDLVYVRGGTYTCTSTSNQNLTSKSGVSGNLIKIWAYPNETPIFSYAGTAFSTASFGIRLGSANYIHIKGLRVTQMPQVSVGQAHTGFMLSGSSNNIIEKCEADHIGGYGNVLNNSNNNLILNCDSHHNADPYSSPAYGGANGFMITSASNTSTGNTYRGCRSWWNSDDGFDFYASPGNITIENCWAFWNGYVPGTFNTAGNGSGFKLGPTALSESTTIRKTVKNCLSFENRTIGFDRNGAKHAFLLYNNVAYSNKAGGFNFYNLPGITNIVRNNISYANTNFNSYFDTGATVDHNSFQGGTSDFPNSACNVTNADFVSISSVGMDGARQADGSLPVLSFLHLAAGSDLINTGINVGLPFNSVAPDMGAYEYISDNINQIPSILNQSFQFNANSPNGTAIGTVIATDPNAGQTLTFSILSGNTNNAFAVNASSGTITVANSGALVNSAGGNSYTVLQSATPSNSTTNYLGDGTAPLEVGMKFRSSAAGYITGFRYFKGSGAQGVHIGNLWSIAGKNLASATFTGETASGWQTAILATPIAISANTIYVVSYFSPHGDIVKTSPYFTADIMNGPLTALGWTDAQPNGVYNYNATSSFPNNNAYIGSSNYWADVIFSSTPPPAPFALVVKVQDNGTGNLSNQATMAINLLSMNKLPTITNQAFTVSENSPVGTAVGSVVAYDPDAVQGLTYSIVSGNTNGAFAINASTGALTVAVSSALNYKVSTSFDLIVEVQDNGTGNLSNQATINVTIELTTTSLEDPGQTAIGMHIYPNPVTNGILNVKLDDGMHEQFDLSILDLSGRLLLQKHFEQANLISLDLAAFPPALYLLQVRSPDFQFSDKFIIR